eukprot:CAMPEP_0195507850 /NCGR_PEP_ID=MMETSP0794_2-20130614/1216_1 /TAXON_ID=515487 /ORGANISM="Stephanopyxis turris, Strain CCMP 815" /LENGTH=413 /DNA_ID=CAMNT_0040634663 /DNA_START=62 /DNA_END=1303 /DNA_ORIENTATION=+
MGKRKVEEEEVAAAAAAEDKAARKKAKKEKKAAKKAKKEAAAAAAAAAAGAPAEKKEKKEKKDKKKKDKKKKDKKAKKEKKETVEAETEAAAPAEAATDAAEEAPATPSKSNGAANPANNPDGITRVFVGNLSWSVDEDAMRKFAEPGVITDIHWVTERDTGKFLGRGFLEFEDAVQAGAFLEKAGQVFMEREIRIDLAQPRQNKSPGGERTPRPLSARPENCTTVFLGNLSFNIDDPDIHSFCKEKGIDAPVNIRWLTDRESGKFRGCGFVEFAESSAVDEFVKHNGAMLLDRALRVDYAEGRKNTPRGGGAGGRTPRPLSEKPEGCTTVFLGNLSYDIEDDDVHAKAKEVGAGDIKNIRWLTDRESGEFKGCGFVEFYSTEDVDKFATLNGKDVKGRSIRVDFAKPRAPRE